MADVDAECVELLDAWLGHLEATLSREGVIRVLDLIITMDADASKRLDEGAKHHARTER
jgi:hypothetical protein